MTESETLQLPRIEHQILIIRGQKVMVDSDLAELYGVETKRFNEAIKRNVARFPEDFMFQLSSDEAESLRSQFATFFISKLLLFLKQAFNFSQVQAIHLRKFGRFIATRIKLNKGLLQCSLFGSFGFKFV